MGCLPTASIQAHDSHITHSSIPIKKQLLVDIPGSTCRVPLLLSIFLYPLPIPMAFGELDRFLQSLYLNFTFMRTISKADSETEWNIHLYLLLQLFVYFTLYHCVQHKYISTTDKSTSKQSVGQKISFLKNMCCLWYITFLATPGSNAAKIVL